MNTTTTTTLDSASTDSIPGYRIVKLLDRGGMGGVFLAEDENLRRQVAIKIINSDLIDSADIKRRFTTEAIIIAGFQHPNIVTVFASGWLGDKPYFVMEYVRGGTLSQRMATQPLTESEACRYGYQMAAALAYSHERDIIHRDIKPSNVLLRDSNTAVLSDFGIAKSVAKTSDETAVGMVIGSARYMAPEQALGQKVSDRADVYSLGLVLHQMLTRDLPQRHPVRTKDDARQLAGALRSVAPACAGLIERCLQVQPESRPTAAECRDSLDLLTRPSPQRMQWPLLAACGIAAAVAVGFGAWRLGFLGPHTVAQTGSTTSADPLQDRMAAVVVARNPSSAKIFVDGNETADNSLFLPFGHHELVGVASGYYGRIEHISVSKEHSRESVNLTLDPSVLPTAEETQRFLKLTESTALTEGDVQSTREQALRDALLAQYFRQTGRESDLQSLSRDVDMLQRCGDARAAVTQLLVETMKAGRINRTLITPSVIAASDHGDAMASFFMAVAYRESLRSSASPITSQDPQFQSYCERMRLAITQGWGNVAIEYGKRDHCMK